MATQLEIRPETADKLAALAKSLGFSLDELLQRVLNDFNSSGVSATAPSLEEFDSDMDAIAEGLDHLKGVYGGSYSRDDIYSDHN